MKRLPAVAFCAMVAATVFAFFLTQALKTADPLVYSYPQPVPQWFHPVSGRVCISKTGQPLNYRYTALPVSVYRTGTVGVYVIDNAGDTVATISQGRYLKRNKPSVFIWRGFENGGTLAPDGTYFFKLVLVSQGRSINLTRYPVTVRTHDPRAPATSVALTAMTAVKTASAARASGPVVLTPPAGSVTIHFKAGSYRRLWIHVYRASAAGALKRVYSFRVDPTQHTATWNGDVRGGVPAPAGTYLIGLRMQDLACNPASYPATLRPSSGTTPGAGVTVRYLAAAPPLTPTPAGSRASVQVDSPLGVYTWALRQVGEHKVLARGQGAPSVATGLGTARVRLPKRRAGLYTLTVAAGQYSAAVPLAASAAPARSARGRGTGVLVVLPMLTWQGQNPVDDTGDGLPDTLSAGDRISLDRPLAAGLPRGFVQDSALIAYLDSRHLSYQLTTDVALAQGVGPALAGHSGVVLAGSEIWLPDRLISALRAFVKRGGTVLSLGTGSLSGSSHISGYPSDPVANAPARMDTDPFGARHGARTATGGELIATIQNPLSILNGAPALAGFSSFEPIEPPAGATAYEAGIAGHAPAVTVFRLGRGYVAEVGLPDFDSSLAANPDSQGLLNAIWQLLTDH